MRLVSRVLMAAVRVAMNYLLWFYLPGQLLSMAPGLISLDSSTITGFAVGIMALSAAGQIVQDRALGRLMAAGAALTSATYLVVLTRLGNLELTIPVAQGLSTDIVLTFAPLVYLLLLPPLLSMLTNVWWLITESSEEQVIQQTIVESP